MESARDKKRDSARKKREFSVYSKKAVRATELRWSKENSCVVKAKPSGEKSN
jgi:hypothetical protein